ncbi:(+)-T-muurolol synthase [compost metagenome]|uniref:terpene synthase family protein n=1 Tax=Achromobacter sp. Root83 TaxID=1736602 RepID=UPI00070B52AE|nr:hypothetical protein [Achromobacter sp. Root83]KRC70397.1 hypothetical protein ASE30_18155 [Achromobacter sp. Root83]
MKLPEINCPFPSAIHPDAQEADIQSIAWMRGLRLCPNEEERLRLERTGCGKLAARIVPHASRQTLQIVSDFFIWNVSFDDEYCDEGPLSTQPGELAQVLARMLRAIDTPEAAVFADDRYACAMREIRLRLEEHATTVQLHQWLETMRGWFFAEVWKAGNVAAHRTPSLEDYAVLRLYSGGALAFPVLAAIAEGYDPPLHWLQSRPVRALTEMAATLCTWASDIVSYEKELRREIGGHNLVCVVQHQFACTAPAALDAAAAMYHEIMELFVRLYGHVSLSSRDIPGAQQYLRSLGYLVRASVDWCRSSERYAAPDPGAPLIAAGGVRDSLPARAAMARAAALGTISWWWRYDPLRASGRDGNGPSA